MALRPLFACRWIEQERGLVPVEFERLVEAVVDSAELRSALDALLARKMAGCEWDKEPPDPVLQAYVDSELARYESFLPAAETSEIMPDLDAFFRKIVLQQF